MPARVLVTGATGFVGSAVCDRLRQRGFSLTRAGRKPSSLCDVAIGDIGPDTDWRLALRNVDCVIHCAARVHALDVNRCQHESAFRGVNTEGTRRLAEQAASMGVRRFVFVSSVKVNGERTDPGRPFTHLDTAAPVGGYAVSKWEAERLLWELASASAMDVTVVRPPLVYGLNVRANFLRLITLIKRGVPLPLGRATNLRSLVFLDNLVDLLVHCVDAPAADGHTFMVSDGEDLSTPELILRLGEAMDRRARLISVPLSMLKFGAACCGRLPEIERLIGWLQVDISHTRETLGWNPPVSVSDGLSRSVKGVA